MKKMLWLLQLSSVREGEFYPLSDSNYNFAKNIIVGLNKIESGLDITLVLPKNISDTEKPELNKFLNDYNIGVYYADKTTSVFGSRYDFNYDDMFKLVRVLKPDYIFEHNPVHVRCWRTILKELVNDTIQLFTYFHWIDSPLFPKVDVNISYWYRQIDGILSADKVFFNSYYAISQIFDSMDDTLKFQKLEYYLKNKCYKIPPSWDADILKYSKEKENNNGIIFNHRLSSLDYYMDNFKMLIEFLSKFEEEFDYIPDVYFTNPSRKLMPKIDNLSSDSLGKLHALELNEVEYYKFLGGNKVGIAPNLFLTSKGMWSIATMEAGVLGNAVIMPKMYGYAEMAIHYYAGFFDNKAGAYRLFRELILNASFRKMLDEEFIAYAGYFKSTSVAKDFLNIIEE